MSELSKVDIELLQDLKSRIEEIAGIQSHIDLTQKDFDFLIYYIEQKTGSRLSLTTIKRIWKDDYKRLPHISTLNMLSQLAFQVDWLTLKKDRLENQPFETINTEAHLPDSSGGGHKNKSRVKAFFVIALFLLVFMLAGYYYFFNNSRPVDTDQIEFSAKVTADGKVPNTVIFSYDVSNIDAKRFFIQQSWDTVRRVEIAKTNTKQTDVYYEPGYHYAKLFADDQIIKEIPVHIRYNDWFVRLSYPNSEIKVINDLDLNRKGDLEINRGYLIRSPENFRNGYQLGYMLSRDFGVSGDDFQFSTSFKMDSTMAPSCPSMALLIKGDRDYTWIDFGNKGCESNLGFKFGDKFISGKTSDLSEFGVQIFDWQNLALKVSGGKVILYMNKKLILQTAYTNKMGDIKEIDIFYYGIGAIDNIELKNSRGEVKFAEAFD